VDKCPCFRLNNQVFVIVFKLLTCVGEKGPSDIGVFEIVVLNRAIALKQMSDKGCLACLAGSHNGNHPVRSQ
jgi:hypothetical protein